MRPRVISNALVAALVGSAAPATGADRPALRIVTNSPLVVVGVGFNAGERVTVSTLTTVRRKRVVVHATAKGRIKASFGKIAQPCATPFAVRAVGAESGAALARVAARPCVPPPVE